MSRRTVPVEASEEPVVAHADEAFIVLVKPVGWLSQPGKVQSPDVCSWARERAAPNALLVHRLDMETSGLMILARGRDAQRRLGEAFRRRRVDKSYEAIVAGIPPRASGEISLRQRLDVNDRPRQVVDWLLG
ncbi:MAG: RNA pseudouridine synthase, partial [Planctomycetota bacterium]